MKRNALKIINARENNLKNLSIEIPHNKFVTITGLSGSGKSSLAFDTVYAEGQRRYIETFSPYTRQFFDKVKKPAVDLIEQVRPAIAIEQRTKITNSRSTVGSMTNINDYLKILWSNLATPVCPTCGIELASLSSKELAARLNVILPVRERSAFLVCAPLKMPKPSKTRQAECDRLLTLGFSRYLDPNSGVTSQIEDGYKLTVDDELLVVLDRFRIESIDQKRLVESIEQAFAISIAANSSLSRCLVVELEGAKVLVRRPLARVYNAPQQVSSRPLPFSALEFYKQPHCLCGDLNLPKARPALFTFNHPLGACENCKGFGKVLEADHKLCVPNPSLSLEEKALQCWAGAGGKVESKRLAKYCTAQKIPTNIPWRDLSETHRNLIFTHKSRDYRGVIPWFKALERKSYKMHVRVFLSRYRSQKDCPICGGSRLKPSSLAYRVNGLTLPTIWAMTIDQLLSWLKELEENVKGKNLLASQLKEAFGSTLARLEYLTELGLGYLTLDRQARTLSGGETQRVNLATALGSELVSTHFVLDEPSVGLHARDTSRLISAIKRLKERGNSLLVVEHDIDCISQSEHVIELGPLAGSKGGEVVYNDVRSNWHDAHLPKPSLAKATPKARKFLKILNASARNLKGFDLNIPLQRFVALTGVSGSGKSTLVSEVLQKAYLDWKSSASPNKQVHGFEHLEQVLVINQSPLAKSPRANIATYSGIWDELRKQLAATDDAQSKALSKSAFSFNVDGGRCPACKGAGFITEEMQFLSDVYIPCDICLGRRFQQSVLDVQFLGLNVHQLLNLSLEECEEKLAGLPSVASAAKTLCKLGLGHLTLGHPLSALSGGEAQRLKLVPFVEQSSKGNSLLIFDEPTTGLHLSDIQRLIELFQSLRDNGHSILCIEHNLHLILASDWLIDLGPEAGAKGGEIVFEGRPQELIEDNPPGCLTGHFLKQYFEQSNRSNPIIVRPKKTTSQLLKEQAASSNLVANQTLSIRGAREHNLKSIDLDLPLNKFIAITGVSGSGKSTLAKDIIYAEGQRRYLDCLSPYARQYIKELSRPEVLSISNVQPTICVYQHTFQPGRLSTVGTMCEVYNFLRLMYAKIGTQYCPTHPDCSISPLSPKEIALAIKGLKHSSVKILAPIIKLKKGTHKAILERAIQSEVIEVRIDGVFFKPGTLASAGGGLEKTKPHSIDYVIAKFNPTQLDVELIEEAVRQALALGAGTVLAQADKSEYVYSLDRTCHKCKTGFFKPDPEDLSFHSRRGACSNCSGSGVEDDSSCCKSCNGSRLNPIGSNIRIDGLNIFEATLKNAPELRDFLSKLLLDERSKKIADSILQELLAKLETLCGIGLDYISLARDCSSLSGGELQRLRLATAMGSPLCGVMYIFDEPSVGLHPADNVKVIEKLQSLKDRGNSVLMIEHDAESILSAEYVLEIGPGGGAKGGEIVFNGPRSSFSTSPTSLTAQAFREPIANLKSDAHSSTGLLSIQNASRNNIKNLSLDIPLGCMVTVVGVSGAGKSSLVHGIIADCINYGEKKNNAWTYGNNTISSTTSIAQTLLVDQKPIGANSRSTPASYLGLWDEIRNLFASSIDAKSRGWKPGFFSYNTGAGRCTDCKGQGIVKLEMSFLADAAVTCETCDGLRYGEDALSVRYLGYTISEVLRLTFEEARTIFANHRKIHRYIQQACDLGLGYLTLGQSSASLSGGESQRLKLVAELSTPRTEHVLYILDEPTTGLHRLDVQKLMKVLSGLTDIGHSVVLIEHDADVISVSDHLIEMGPGPGATGGQVIYSGTPKALLKQDSPWGFWLRKLNLTAKASYHNKAIKPPLESKCEI